MIGSGAEDPVPGQVHRRPLGVVEPKELVMFAETVQLVALNHEDSAQMEEGS